MDRIIGSTERDALASGRSPAINTGRGRDATAAVCAALHTMAQVLPVAATVAYTTSGATTLRVAHEWPHAPILSLTPNLAVARKLALVWGVHSVCTGGADSVEDMVAKAEQVAALLRLVWPEMAEVCQ